MTVGDIFITLESSSATSAPTGRHAQSSQGDLAWPGDRLLCRKGLLLTLMCVLGVHSFHFSCTYYREPSQSLWKTKLTDVYLGIKYFEIHALFFPNTYNPRISETPPSITDVIWKQSFYLGFLLWPTNSTGFVIFIFSSLGSAKLAVSFGNELGCYSHPSQSENQLIVQWIEIEVFI